jgi:serine/threonine protein kinase
MLDHADSDNDHNDEEIDKQYTMDPTHNKTPTPVMGRSSVIQDQCDDGFPMTEPVYDSKMDDELCALNEEEEEQELLLQYGYRKTKVITKTLQGNIFIAEQIYSDLQLNKKDSNKSKANLKAKKVVIKKTSKALHKEHVTVQNGKKFGIYENILKECIILKHLTENKSGLIMTSFTKFENFFDTDADYYLVMEHGGSDLFDFIIEAHELINDKRLKIKEWRKFAKYLFWQMIVVLRWLHNDMNTCHLDISLENILIKNAEFIPADKDSKKYVTVNPNVQIKFCDFGLAEIFKANTVEFECTKFCGKTNYKAPEVYSKGGIFDARKADIWSLGVVLFCMLVGSPPYNKPVDSDQAYLYIKNSIIDQLLFQWERNHFITVKVLSLMHSMLRFDPAQRFLVDDVIKHPWLSLYYHKYKYQMKKKSTLQHQKNKRAQARLPFYNLPIKSSSVATSASKPSLISH